MSKSHSQGELLLNEKPRILIEADGSLNLDGTATYCMLIELLMFNKIYKGNGQYTEDVLRMYG